MCCRKRLLSKQKKTAPGNHDYTVRITHSNGIKDLDKSTENKYKISELINFNSKEKILHLPVNGIEDKIIKLFRSWNGNLGKYHIQISTGPVVSFRAKKYLFDQPQNHGSVLVPFYQLQNTAKMSFVWPVKKKGKPQYVELCEQTKSILIPNRNYVFLRRFSAKDDKSRLVATPYFADIGKGEYIGVENHLNYIYGPSGHLDQNEILGLAALLNSSLFDRYFRTFNGNINVSATELREMPLPPIRDLKDIGNELILTNNFSQISVDEIITSHFKLNGQFLSNE
jgi:adenine-specific DNA-methyltransferase